MRVYIVRHGEAADANSDSARPLSDAGRAEVTKLAEHVAREGIRVGAVWHSPKVRAKQTAEILHAIGKLGGNLAQHGGLRPEDDAEPIAAELQSLNHDVCLVGHMPHVASLTFALLRGHADLRFSTATMVCLERDGNGKWRLLWHVNPAEI